MPNTTDVSAASSTQPAAAPTTAPVTAGATPSAKKAASRSQSASAPKKVPAARKKAAAKPAETSTPVRDTKAKKPKLVRDSFTIPKDEYAAIEALKLRSGQLGTTAKKSELLRAGLKLLSALSNDALAKALQDVPSIKTGRPKAQASAPSTTAAKKATKPAKTAPRK
ncbi:hypothetical protein [Paracidovorax valerianellae]|uniref:Uncharacterized protein n=1 Tax=Paracidovorax valerianellae TaxID=187868 RepID=A0A1G6IX95_9BURK|nr:hypothetical protein [Paracidovorax valerianellae]MDA8443678.1 hypothetical protein [Paracidovorax valerianellae]SDC11021.1 hypothetical protein SAMN05192589_101267 [Paracidovorax valerianellae]